MSKYNISKQEELLKLVESGEIELAYDGVPLLEGEKEIMRYEIELDGYNVFTYYKDGICIACQDDGKVYLYEQKDNDINYEILTDIMYCGAMIAELKIRTDYTKFIKDVEYFAECIWGE